MDIPEMVTAITPEAVIAEQQLHYVLKETATALCGMEGRLTDDETPDAWWPMSERRAFEGMYSSCGPCHQEHRRLVEAWADAKWPNRRRAVPS